MRIPLLTIDYELFGNGKGEIFNDLIYPTERLFDIFSLLKEQALFFVEGLEFYMLEKNGEDVRSVRKQIREMALRGHKVGLHVHPQWMVEQSRIAERDLELSQWYCNSDDITEDILLSAIKCSLEFISSCLPEGVKVEFFRAGAFAAAPSESLGRILKGMGISYDSSIVPGYKNYKFGSIDYEYLHEDYLRGYEASIHDFRKVERGSEFYEYPIGAFGFNQLLSVSTNNLLTRLFKKEGIQTPNFSRPQNFSSTRPIDFGTMNSISFLIAIRSYLKRGYLPVIITHSKSLTIYDNVVANILIFKYFKWILIKKSQ